MNIHDANLIINKLANSCECNVDVFNKDGKYISGLSSDQSNMEKELLEKVINQELVLTNYDDSFKQLYLTLPSDNEVFAIIRFSSENNLSSSFSKILNQYVHFMVSDESITLSNSLKERSIRDFGRDLVKDIDEEKYQLCQKNAKVLDIDLDTPRYIIALDYSDNFLDNVTINEYDLQSFKSYIYTSTKLFTKESIFFNLSKETYVLLLDIEKNTIINIDELYEKFASIVTRKPTMGIGYVCSNIYNYSTSLNLALSAISYGKIIKPNQHIFRWDEFQIPILMLSGNKKIRDAILDASSDLINYLVQHKEITKTIIEFFDCGMNVDKTANNMHYHRNTILYRLNSFIDDSNINIFNAKNCSEVYNLALLLKAENILSNNN